MQPKNLTKKELNRVWKEHISPLLREYLRGEYGNDMNKIQDSLDKAEKIYTFK
jgi:hypothetical protein